MKGELSPSEIQLKESLKKKALTVKSIIIGTLTVMITLNVLYAWALPTREVECIEDKVLTFFTDLLQSFKLAEYQRTLLFLCVGFSFDIFISYLIFRYVFRQGEISFVAKVASIIAFRYFCDFFYHPSIQEDNMPMSPFYSISFSKNNGNLVNHSIAITVLGYINLCKSDELPRVAKVLILLLVVAQSVLLMMLNAKYSVQVIFSFILAHYVDLIIKF